MTTEARMDDRPIRILLIDDDEDDFVLTRDLLTDIQNSRFQLEWVSDIDQALEEMCSRKYDVFLVDYNLGRTDGLTLLKMAIERGCSAPIIVLTGHGKRAIDLGAMQAGAADFLEKSGLDATHLERSIRYSLRHKGHAEGLERRVHERTAELARANEALQQEIAERLRVEKALREAGRRKDQFLATLAHELRNPLVPIRNALEIMRLAGDAPATVESNRALIVRQVKQLVRLIDDLLDVARMTVGTIRLKRENVEISRLVAKAVESTRPFIDAAGHQLTVALPEEPIVVNVDPARIVHVLHNLLHNAAKYMDRGGSIWLTVERGDGQVLLRVRDTGIGIPADLLGEVFEMFTQTKQHQERTTGGLGIGLALVKMLVQLHGGSVEASSAGPGQGSEFLVRLPLP
jgi:signal transduction histidine kinase